MKLNSLLKKWIHLSSIVNLLTFIFVSILIIVVFYYQFGLMIPTNYQVLAPNAEGAVDFSFGYEFIHNNGFAAFFASPLGGGTYWQLVLSFYVLSILFASFNFIFNAVVIYLGSKYKNSSVLNIGVTALFLPLIGFIFAQKFLIKFRSTIIHKPDKTTAKKTLLKELEESINQKLAA
ncbi:hypothetical protein J2Z62_000043 [Mycoplasmoides fastidiosum]|uniref:Uncharacterized protein n=1 Tax=Mycoplasmoides fastidiosum TaxID=92758 RepID=A0ABU0LY49_9BACT|nr:hypothetical protein [Mycoplasmoides fastidiosum]MDQ0513605.1 hypothetical protein [Mycoplasmoides fastidiosum]UUD37972.1 hypothetical protein NPA10_01080 [Mycoplasmoides fastidiosum]